MVFDHDASDSSEGRALRDLLRRLAVAKMALDRTYSNYVFKRCGLHEVTVSAAELQDILAEAVDLQEE